MRLRIWGALLLVASSFSLPSLASASDEENPWIPAISGSTGVYSQSMDARGSSSPAARPSISGDTNMLFPFLGLTAELSTPKLPLPGAPALFIRGGVDFSIASTWNVAKEGSVGKVEVPRTPIGGFPSAEGVSGTGTTASAEPNLANYKAALGASFEFTALDRTLRIRPSVEYRYDAINYRLRMKDADEISGALCPCAIASLSQHKGSDYHSIGPGLELEMDAVRSGPIMVSVFASTQAYYLLGNENTSFNLSGVYEPSLPANEPVTANANFERDTWSFQAGVGLRFRWLPETFD